MVDAVVGQGGAIALAAGTAAGQVAQGGAIALAAGMAAGRGVHGGAIALAAGTAPGRVVHGGAIALVRYAGPYRMAQGGLIALVSYMPPAVRAVPPAPRLPPGTPVDIQVAYNPAIKGCDVVFNGTDFALDTTNVSAVLLSIFTDRRARPDDVLPDAVSDFADPQSFIAQRGWCGDGLDAQGRLAGSRSWLNSRAKETEATRQAEETYLAESLQWIEDQRGAALQLTVRLPGKGILAFRIRVGKSTIMLNRTLN
jgi:phage gp46-like protein